MSETSSSPDISLGSNVSLNEASLTFSLLFASHLAINELQISQILQVYPRQELTQLPFSYLPV